MSYFPVTEHTSKQLPFPFKTSKNEENVNEFMKCVKCDGWWGCKCNSMHNDIVCDDDESQWTLATTAGVKYGNACVQWLI